MRRDPLSTNRRGHRARGMGQRRCRKRQHRRRVSTRAAARETSQARSLPSCGCGTRLGQPIRAASGTAVDDPSGGNGGLEYGGVAASLYTERETRPFTNVGWYIHYSVISVPVISTVDIAAPRILSWGTETETDSQ